MDSGDGVMVGPGVFKAMREQFDGRGALAVPDQKAGCRGAESTHHPKNIFHWRCSFFALGLRYLRCGHTMHLAGWMRRSSDVLLVCEWLSRVWRERLHFEVWIRFALDGCWELERV